MDAVQICPKGKLVYGMQMPITAQSTVFAAPWEATAGTAEILNIAQACDANGFFYLAVSDHVCVPREQANAMSTVWYDTIATLGFLAAATQRVRLLSYVYVAPYRHPLMTAKAFATLDALSGGRVILSVGLGASIDFLTDLGMANVAARGRQLVEKLGDRHAGASPPFTRHCSAPEGQRATWAATASADASSGRTQRARLTSNTAGNPRMQMPEWTHTFGSNVTVMCGVS